MLTGAGIALAAIALAAAWLGGIRWWYRMVEPRPKRLTALCEDGWELAVYHRPALERRFEEPVLLAHGLAVTHLNLDFDPPYSVAHALNQAGFDCFSVDWRGNGGSTRAPKGRSSHDYSVDDHIQYDGPAAVALVLRVAGATRAFWVGHSLGGLVGYGVAGLPAPAPLAGLVTLGSPAFFIEPSPILQRAMRLLRPLAWPRRLRQRLLTWALAPWLGLASLPLADSVVNPQHIDPRIRRKLFANLFVSVSGKMLRQFADWISTGTFRSLDGAVDYRARMRGIQVPALVAGGAVDRLVTPASVKASYEALGSPDKTLVVFGTEHGDGMDYGHGDLVFGRGAPAEVYPLLRRWLEEHATRVSPETTTGDALVGRPPPGSPG